MPYDVDQVCSGSCVCMLIKCVQVHANANKKRFDGYLVLTDGYAPDPKGHNRLKRGWVIVPTGQLEFDSSTRDFVIQMRGNAS